MTNYINTAENGQADEAVVTTATTDDGSAGTGFTVNLAATGTVKKDTAKFHRGTSSYRMDAPVTGDVARGTITLAATPQASIQPHFLCSAYPTAELTILSINSPVGSAFLNITAAGKLRLYDGSGIAIWLSTNPMPLNAFWRPSLGVLKGTTTADGTLRAGVFHGANLESATPTEEFVDITADAGTADFTSMRFGKSGSGLVWTVWADDIQWSDSSAAHMAPVPNAGPVLAYSRATIVEIDTSGTSGSGLTKTLVRTAGPAVTITGPVAEVFRVILPEPFTSAVTLSYSATDGVNPVASTSIVISPTGGGGVAVQSDLLTLNSLGAWV